MKASSNVTTCYKTAHLKTSDKDETLCLCQRYEQAQLHRLLPPALSRCDLVVPSVIEV